MNIQLIRNQVIQQTNTANNSAESSQNNPQQNKPQAFDVTQAPRGNTLIPNSSIWLSPSQQNGLTQLQTELAVEAKKNPGFYPRRDNSDFGYEDQLHSFLSTVGIAEPEINKVLEQRQSQLNDPSYLQAVRDQVTADFVPSNLSDFPIPGNSMGVFQPSIDLDAINERRFDNALRAALEPGFVPKRGADFSYQDQLETFLSEIGIDPAEIKRALEQRTIEHRMVAQQLT